jgi:hypothetical protein
MPDGERGWQFSNSQVLDLSLSCRDGGYAVCMTAPHFLQVRKSSLPKNR